MTRGFVRAGLVAGLIHVALGVNSLHADAPPSRYVVDADTVTDTKTTLVWQRDSVKMSSTEAPSYCAGLTLDGGGWRLPGIKELATIVDPSRYSPAIDATVFPNTAVTGYYWSASAVTTIVGLRVWKIYFATGGIWVADTGASNWTRCVR